MTGVRTSQIGHLVRTVVNPVSTAATRWWCHSALRRAVTGYGPTARQRRHVRSRMMGSAGHVPSAARLTARTAVADRLLGVLRTSDPEK